MASQYRSITENAESISGPIVIFYGVIFCIVLYVIFARNVACLLYGLDGTGWLLRFKAQAAREAFSQLGVDPWARQFRCIFAAAPGILFA